MVECGVDLEGHYVMLRVLRAEIVDVVMVVKDRGCVVYVLLDVLLDHRVVEAAAATAMETVRPLGFKTIHSKERVEWWQIMQQWKQQRRQRGRLSGPWASRPRFNRCGSRLSSSGDGDGGCPALGLKKQSQSSETEDQT